MGELYLPHPDMERFLYGLFDCLSNVADLQRAAATPLKTPMAQNVYNNCITKTVVILI